MYLIFVNKIMIKEFLKVRNELNRYGGIGASLGMGSPARQPGPKMA
jgi:hypothetical protein